MGESIERMQEKLNILEEKKKKKKEFTPLAGPVMAFKFFKFCQNSHIYTSFAIVITCLIIL